jgi:hypothetical protein
MRRKRLISSLLALLSLLAGSPGCRVINGYRPVTILVQDAETGEPVPGARVRVGYYLLVDPRAPKLRIGTTDDEGLVTLRVAPYEGRAVMVATAEGYFTEGMRSLSDAEIGRFEPGDGKRARPFVVLPMYAEPAAVVELVVPTGYRGLFKVETQTDDHLAPRQRLFGVHVEPSGLAVLKGPGLLQRADGVDLRARYEDGTPLEPAAGPDAVGLWELGEPSEPVRYFFVGTGKEHDESYPLFHRETAEGGWEFSREVAEGWLARRRGAERGSGSPP